MNKTFHFAFMLQIKSFLMEKVLVVVNQLDIYMDYEVLNAVKVFGICKWKCCETFVLAFSNSMRNYLIFKLCNFVYIPHKYLRKQILFGLSFWISVSNIVIECYSLENSNTLKVTTCIWSALDFNHLLVLCFPILRQKVGR